MTEEFIISILPELNEVQDTAIRAKCIAALKLAMERGGWNEENIFLAPVTVNWENVHCTLIEHIRTVTKACLEVYNLVAHFYVANGKPLDRDLLIGGALIHDIGKFTEFTLVDGKPVHNPSADLMRHPLSGALMAAEVGLPTEYVHLIATHSFEGDKSTQTPESRFMRELDMFVFTSTVSGLKKKG